MFPRYDDDGKPKRVIRWQDGVPIYGKEKCNPKHDYKLGALIRCSDPREGPHGTTYTVQRWVCANCGHIDAHRV